MAEQGILVLNTRNPEFETGRGAIRPSHGAGGEDGLRRWLHSVEQVEATAPTSRSFRRRFRPW